MKLISSHLIVKNRFYYLLACVLQTFVKNRFSYLLVCVLQAFSIPHMTLKVSLT